MLRIQKVSNNPDELQMVRELFHEYSIGLNENLCFQSFEEELQNPLKKYGEPEGCLFVAYWNNEAAGCIALQPLRQKGVCEMKRLYVRPIFQKKGIGEELIKTLLHESVVKGY